MLKSRSGHNKWTPLSGFTLVEIVVAVVIIVVASGGSFAAYVYARQYSNKFLYRAMASSSAHAVADYIRYSLDDGYKNLAYLNEGTYDYSTVAESHLNYDAVLTGLLKPETWPIFNRVEDLDISYTVTDVRFDIDGQEILAPGLDPRSRFKKVAVKITYKNRKTI